MDFTRSKSWVKPTVLLCIYGLFSYTKPSEPFITPFLMGPNKNLTEEEVVNEIYPVWTYSYLALLFPIFLLTDYVKYKPIIMLQGLGYIACWLVLLFGQGVPVMQLMQFFYAIATSCEIGYYSYIYSIVDNKYYQRVTSYVRASTLFGLFIGSLLAQLLVSFADVSYFTLNVISLVNVSIGFIISLFLPMPRTTLFFNNEAPIVNGTDFHSGENGKDQHESAGFKESLKQLAKDAWDCYRNVTLLRWSVWWALSTCGWILVVNYIQNLWETIQPSTENEVYNGAVESIATVLGACGAILVGYIEIDWTKWGELALGFCSLVKCSILALLYVTTNIWVSYVGYVLFIFFYNFVITITQFQIAVGLNTKRFALVFGVNSFMALLLNTILTVILIDQVGLALDVNSQFVVYSGYFGLVALIFLLHAVYSLCIVGNLRPQIYEEENNLQTKKLNTSL